MYRVATLEEVQVLAVMAGRSLLEVDEELRIEGMLREDYIPGLSPGGRSSRATTPA